MKKVFAMIAIVAASLVMASCNNNKDKNAESEATEAQEQLDDAQKQAEETQAQLATQLVGVWTAKVPAADNGVGSVYTLTIKDGQIYSLAEVNDKVAADKLVNVQDANYTIEGNIITLSDGKKLEFDGNESKLYWLKDDMSRATEDNENYVYTRVTEAK